VSEKKKKTRGVVIHSNSTEDEKRMTAWCNLVKIAVIVKAKLEQ